jgi:hypothetical protein
MLYIETDKQACAESDREPEHVDEREYLVLEDTSNRGFEWKVKTHGEGIRYKV